MTSWFDKGRPALFEALNAVCQQIDKELSAELQQKENKASEPSDESRGKSEDTALASAETKDWKAEYAKLSAKFNALSGNFKKAREALQRRRDERDRWIEHAALLEKKVKSAEEEHGIQILDHNTRQTRASSHLETGSARPARDASFTSDVCLEHVDAPASSRLSPSPTTAPGNDKDMPPGQDPDSTQGESEGKPEEELPQLPQAQDAGELNIKQEPSSDGPVLVSERCLRKRKRDDQSKTPAARAIKAEPRDEGSSPGVSLHHYDFNPHESLDLGDVAQMYTPRKRRELEVAQHLNQQPVHLEPPSIPAAERRDGENSASRSVTSSAVTPVAVNEQLPNWTASKPTDNPLSKGLSHGIGMLAEDGGQYKKAANGVFTNGKGASPAVKSRLDTLLNSPSPIGDPPSITHSARRMPGTPATSREELAILKPRELPFEKSTRQSTRHSNTFTPQTPRTPLADTTNTYQKSKPTLMGKKSHRAPLRDKPPSELRLDDFKVNPHGNGGHDFAYSEVVRDKDERACLPGCVDMHCCGKQFRALAMSQRPDPPLTATQRQEEQRLLENYLGDYSYRLATMTREERSELWVEAKTRELADKFGKHRHRFSRMQSPPGFWNADFPSTQELETDRAEAAKRERQSVQERHREAMRPGGRWVFRDE